MKNYPRLVVVGATGWYGKTLIDEYLLAYGAEAAKKNLLLFASSNKSLVILSDSKSFSFQVHSLSEITNFDLSSYDGLIWYAFLLKNKIPTYGLTAFKETNDFIASSVFRAIHKFPNLMTIYFSSGITYGLTSPPAFEDDPYANLKYVYETELKNSCRLVTFFPYATTGKFVPDVRSFAIASFIYQAMRSTSLTIEASHPVVRSYGSVHDFSRLILRLFSKHYSGLADFPSEVVPVTHTFELHQLACEVLAALGVSNLKIISSSNSNACPDVYVSPVFNYPALLRKFDLNPTDFLSQVRGMSSGTVFRSRQQSY